MSAFDLIGRAIEAGVKMTLGESGLQLQSDRPPCAALLAELVAHKVEIVEALSAANDPLQSRVWLHLLVLNNGRVIQRAGNQPTASVELAAKQRYGRSVLAVVAVPGFERVLCDAEITKALAGSLEAPGANTAGSEPSARLLTRVARLLGTRPAELLEGGFVDQHDLIEQAGMDARLIADAIGCNPAWIDRPRRAEGMQLNPEPSDSGPQHVVHTAATAPQAWRDARDRYVSHRMVCMRCRSPSGLPCAVGDELRSRYVLADFAEEGH
ncbi:hypothetical protein [Stutzerimonas kunmingensis]|uniref:hypothetical protein n=1 Tax=Stutzerimonas kunmingensis TaxID=1211807 RepID=UPI00241E3712|nr:hypothetical protein [Stutzerimonas kunmingensis]